MLIVYPGPRGTALGAGPELRAQCKWQPLLLLTSGAPAHRGNIYTPCAAQQCKQHRAGTCGTHPASAPALGVAAGRCSHLTQVHALLGHGCRALVYAGFLQGAALAAAPQRAPKAQGSKDSTRGEESSEAQAMILQQTSALSIETMGFSKIAPSKNTSKSQTTLIASHSYCCRQGLCTGQQVEKLLP